MPSELVRRCAAVLADKSLTIAFAESVTAGRLAFEFSLTEHAGRILKGGLVCYDAEVKEQNLGVAPALVHEFTPESAEVTKEMAIRLKELMKADVQVAVTGLTTPGGSESPRKPVGTIFVHILLNGSSLAAHDVFEGSPEEIVLLAVDMAARTIVEELEGAKA